MGYSAHEMHKVTNTICQIILSQPEKLKELGVFRESGNKKTIQTIIDSILKVDSTTLSVDNYSIHDYIGAMKNVLFHRNNRLTNNEYKQFIERTLQAIDQAKIDDLFIHLIHSESHENLYLAKAFYSYIRLAAMAARYQQFNRMDAHNLGLLIGACLSIDDSMRDVRDLSRFAERVIAEEQLSADLSFHAYLAEKQTEHFPILIHFIESQLKKAQNQLEKTENYIACSEKSEQTNNKIMSSNTLQLRAVKGSLAHLPSRPTSKKTDKQIKRQLEYRCEELTTQMETTEKDGIVIHQSKISAQQQASNLQKDISHYSNYLSSLKTLENKSWSKAFTSQADEQLDKIKKDQFENGGIEGRFFKRRQNHLSLRDIAINHPNLK